MATGFIELNDADILQAVDGALKDASIGYAVLDGEKLLTGEEARKNARLLPRWTNNRFWYQLNTDPIPNATRTIRHNADVAFAQLEAFKHTLQSVDQLVLAVPPNWDKNRLGLLLGMAREAGLPIKGLVDASVLTVADQDLPPLSLYLDISLHEVTLTSLAVDGVLRRKETRVIGETGLFTLWDRWANIIARQFIQTGRYDPMHQASSEQQLFDRLPAWLAETSGKPAGNFDIDAGGAKHTTQITTDQLVTACANLYPAIVQSIRALAPNGAHLFVSHRFKGFPGLDESLRLISEVEVSHLAPEAIIQASTSHWTRLISKGEQVALVSQLPAERVRQPGQTKADKPTHLLVGHHAVSLPQALKVGAISEQGIVESTDAAFTLLQRDGKLVLLIAEAAEVTVNDAPVDTESTLAVGDSISLGGHVARLIRVI